MCNKCTILYNKSLAASFLSSGSFLEGKSIRVSVGETSNVKNLNTFSTGRLENKNKLDNTNPEANLAKLYTIDKLRLCLWNSQSLRNKLNIVDDYRKENHLDIMVFTESWLKEDEMVAIGQLENAGNYKYITKSRLSRSGGGIGCLFKSNIKVDKVVSPDSKTFEHLALKIYGHGKQILLLTIYRPESSPKNRYTMSEFFSEFSSLLALYHGGNHELMIMGDFNLHINKPHLTNVIKFNEILEMFSLTQHVKSPTHNAGNILDLVITRKDSNLLTECNVGELLSDHYSILLRVNLSKPKPAKKLVKFRKTRNIDMAKLKKDVANHLSGMNRLAESTGPEYLKSLINLYEKCTNILDQHAPIQEKMITIRNNTPWNNSDIKEAKTAKRRAEKKWRKTRSQVDFDNFKEKRNQYNKTLNNLRTQYLTKKIHENKGNSKALFKIINSSLNRKAISPLPPHENEKTLATDFSKFFEEKIDKIKLKLKCTAAENKVETKTYIGVPLKNFQPFKNEDIRKIITKMATKHCKLDPLPTWMVKECLNEFLPIITKIVNTSLQLGIVPDCHKHAIINPILKKPGLDPNLNNYRPVSNLKFLSKIIEGAAIEQFNKHLNDNRLHDTRQSAYKKFHSTETLLTRIHNDIMENGNSGNETLLVMLDLSAAFDTIDHKILLSRLHNMYGIEGTALKWFKSYITDRTSSVAINESTSDKMKLKCGVPQGSKLGPVLFNTYVAPMSEIARKHGISDQKYSDDEQLILSFKPNNADAKNATTKMEKCIEDIRIFLKDNKLCNNGSKTEIIIIGMKSQHKNFQPEKVAIDKLPIEYTDNVRNLGVIFDKHMTMEKQINKMCKSAYFNIKYISFIRKSLNKNDTKSIVNALVTPHLDYGNGLLYGIPNKHLNKLQVAQNMAVRLIEKIGKYDHVTMKRKNLHWLPIHARIKYKLLTTTWKILNCQAPGYLESLIKLKNSARNLRSSNTKMLEVNNDRVNSWGLRSFRNVSPLLWNNLPEKIRLIDNLNCFKKHLKTHLFTIYYPDDT